MKSKFTLLLILASISILYAQEGDMHDATCSHEDISEREKLLTIPATLKQVKSLSSKTSTLAKVSNIDAQLQISPNNLAVSLLVSDEHEQDRQLDRDEIKVFNEIIYTHFEDAFDIIFYIENSDEGGSWDYSAREHNIQNNTQGIGLRTFDYSKSYFSDAKLLSVIHLTKRNYLTRGPSLHEVTHLWANFALATNMSAHWGITGFQSGGGQLGGFDSTTLTANDNNYTAVKSPGASYFGEFANGGNSLPYNNFELYLMGLIPPEDVQDISLATNPTKIANDTFTADGIDTISIEDIIVENGERVPDYTTSQKSFRALVVVLTQEVLTQSDWDTVEGTISSFSYKGNDSSYLYNFYEATGGRADIKMDSVSQTLKTSTPKGSLESIITYLLF